MFSCKDMNAYKIPKHKKSGKKQIKLHVYKKFHNIRDIHPSKIKISTNVIISY